jgi:HEAT repeat protein
VKLLPTTRRGRLALAGGVLAALALAAWCYEYRPWEAHYLGRPTSWWDRALTRVCEGPPQPAWPAALGIHLPDPEPRFPPPPEDDPEGYLGRGGPDAVPVLIGLLASRNPVNRRTAAILLRDLGPGAGTAAVPPLLRALGDPDEHVKAASFSALERTDPGAAVPVLARQLTSPAPADRQWAADNLPVLGPGARPAVPALLPLLADPDEDVRRAAFWALHRVDREALASGLAGHLTNPAPSQRRWAAERLGWLDCEARPALPALLRRLGDPDEDVRAAARGALRQIDPDALATHDRDHPGAGREGGGVTGGAAAPAGPEIR